MIFESLTKKRNRSVAYHPIIIQTPFYVGILVLRNINIS
jgi:hypothetical protein